MTKMIDRLLVQSSLKKWLVCGALCVGCPTFGNANVVFYVNAHPDDLELFMAFNLSHDIYDAPDANTIVVITTTAGDDANGNGNGTGILPYYLAREIGHANALQFLEGLTGTLQGSLFIGSDTLTIPDTLPYNPPVPVQVLYNGAYGRIPVYQAKMWQHPIYWINLRLPDGNNNGADPCRGYGYAATNWQSLTYLNNGRYLNIGTPTGICLDPNKNNNPTIFSSTIGAVDNGNSNSSTYKAIYQNSNDLKAVFRDIIKTFVMQAGNGQTVWANLVDTGPVNAPYDHPDHQATSLLFVQALADPSFSRCNINKAFYTTYINGIVSATNPNVSNPSYTNLKFGTYVLNGGNPIQMSSADANILVGLWATVNQGRNAGGQQNTWDPDHMSWVARQRITTSPVSGVCTF